MGEATTDDDLLLKNFFAEVSEVERENEVLRFSLSFQSLFYFLFICCRESYIFIHRLYIYIYMIGTALN